ncbi:HAD family hydrolase [Aliigemmobacter aestuarii]|uniref:phosphoglycolate phosphatase n=1 Tax=Aliigemmobacter aestuarii TaxID=1445661 RepID=A0A4S3MRL5_9RHOB|nr:HAD family hydrolase [Gemmobacter aestuarii]THD84713.1 HAD family hydrolase [Gemmobacter aestuarii]
MIDGIVFDKDGTLFDFRKSWGAWAQAFLHSVADTADEAAALGGMIGFDLARGEFANDSPVIAGTASEIAECLLPALPGWEFGDLVARINGEAAQAPMAEAVPLAATLGALRNRGLKLGLATNDTEAPARAHLDRHGITPLFDFIAGYDSGHGPKPGPGMCLAFLRETGLQPHRVAMVGDSRHDLQAGRAAGMRTVAVLTGIAEAPELADLADVVLPDIGALQGWIDSLDG